MLRSLLLWWEVPVAKKKDKAHPLFAVSGNHTFLREREIQELTATDAGQGWKIDPVDGSNLEDLFLKLTGRRLRQ